MNYETNGLTTYIARAELYASMSKNGVGIAEISSMFKSMLKQFDKQFKKELEIV